MKKVICPYCGSSNVENDGLVSPDGKLIYSCRDCLCSISINLQDYYSKDKLNVESTKDEMKEWDFKAKQFICKIKGAFMYKTFDENVINFEKMSATDFIGTCFAHGIKLECKLEE